MDDVHQPDRAARLPFQGPHWDREEHPVPVSPLRLVLVPSGACVDLVQSEVLVGRHSQADVRLPLPDVSRRHCRFVFANGSWQVFDLDSLNGIFVNGERVQQAMLREGDTVKIGGFHFGVELHAATPLPPPSQRLRLISEALIEDRQRHDPEQRPAA